MYCHLIIVPFVSYYNCKNQNINLKYNILSFPLTRHKYFVQYCAKYKVLSLITKTPQVSKILKYVEIQFSAYFRYCAINNYNLVNKFKICHICD